MSIYHIKVFLNPVAAYWFACRYILLFILLIRFQFIPGCFPFCPTNSHKSVELSRENESNRGIHLLFDWNFDYAWQSRTGNENFWKWNSASFGWTGPTRQKAPTLKLDHFDRKISMRTEAFHLFLDRNFRIFWHKKSPPHPKNTTVPATGVNFLWFSSCVLTTKRSTYFIESMTSPEINRREVITTCFANVFSFLSCQAFDDKRTLSNILLQLAVMALAESNWGQATSLLLEAQVWCYVILYWKKSNILCCRAYAWRFARCCRHICLQPSQYSRN